MSVTRLLLPLLFTGCLGGYTPPGSGDLLISEARNSIHLDAEPQYVMRYVELVNAGDDTLNAGDFSLFIDDEPAFPLSGTLSPGQTLVFTLGQAHDDYENVFGVAPDGRVVPNHESEAEAYHLVFNDGSGIGGIPEALTDGTLQDSLLVDASEHLGEYHACRRPTGSDTRGEFDPTAWTITGTYYLATDDIEAMSTPGTGLSCP